MLKYIKVILKILPVLIWDYFAWMLRYSLKPSKYDLNKRFLKIQKLIKKVLKAFNVSLDEIDLEKYENSAKNDEARLIVANHISDFDPLIFIALAKRPITVVAKIQILRYPFVNRIIKILEGEFLDRDNLKQSLKVFKSIANKMEKYPNLDWLIFPEGTRNKINVYLPNQFHYGTFKPAMKTNININVFSLLGTQKILDIKCKNKKYPVTLKFDKTFAFDDYKEKSTVELSKEAHKLCLEGVQEIKERNLGLIEKVNQKH